jgi:DNA-binding protein HU-beta/integration host factor subunit beta
MTQAAVRTKRDIITQLTREFHLDTVQARKAVQTVLNGIVDATMEHGRIEIRRFGTFKILHRAARVARNPRTNEELRLPPRFVIAFEPSDQLSQKVMERFMTESPKKVEKEEFVFSMDGQEGQGNEFTRT